jgi:hypothetical protein
MSATMLSPLDIMVLVYWICLLLGAIELVSVVKVPQHNGLQKGLVFIGVAVVVYYLHLWILQVHF